MPWEGAASPYHQPPGRLLEKTLFSIIKKMLMYCTFVAQNKHVFQRVSNKLWPSLLVFLIFRLLGLYCSPSIYNAIKINMEGNGFVLWKKEDISEFQIHSRFYFYLSFMFWEINILRVRTTIILSGSITQTFKTRKRYLCLSSYQNNSRLPNIIFVHFLPVFGNSDNLIQITSWQMDPLSICSQKDIWVQMYMCFFWLEYTRVLLGQTILF